MRLSFRMLLAMFAALALVAAACGSEDSDDAASADEAAEAEGGAAADDGSADDAGSDDGSEDGADTERPTVVVTTTILGDVVENLVGDEVEVVTIMPTGADPHDFQASAAQVAQMNEADVLIVNGGGIEEGLLDVIEAAEEDGVVVFEFLSAVETIEYGEGGHDHDHGDEEHGDDHGDDHGDEEHGDEEHGDDHGDEEHGDDHGDEEHGDEEHGDEEHGDEEHGDDEHGDEEHGDDEHGDDEHGDDHDHAHDHDGADPHFWTDPARMAIAADAAAEFLMANLEGIDADAVTASAEAYVAELEALDAEVEATLSPIPEENRVFVTNHDSFGYFADRFDFEVAGTVIPSGSTLDGTSAQDLAELAEVVEDEGVPAIFTETTVSDDLAQTLADEVGGDVAIVEIYTGSLGEAGSEGDTYIGMQRTNAERIAGALS